MANGIMYPFSEADYTVLADAEIISLSVANNRTIARVNLSQNATLNIELDDELRLGADIYLAVNAREEDVILSFGDNVEGQPVVTNTGKTSLVILVFDGAQFVATLSALSSNTSEETETIQMADSSSDEIGISKPSTIINAALSQTSNLDIQIGEELPTGALLMVVFEALTITANLVFGNNILGPTLMGVLNKIKTITFIFDGTRFIAMGAPVQIN